MILEIGVFRLIIGPRGNHSIGLPRASTATSIVQACDIFLPSKCCRRRRPLSVPFEDGRGMGGIVIDDRSIRTIQFAALDKAVIDVVVEIARMMLGREEIDSVLAVAGIFCVSVYVSEFCFRQEFSPIGPVVAIILEMRIDGSSLIACEKSYVLFSAGR